MAKIALEHLHRTDQQDAAQRTRQLLDAFQAEKPHLVKTVTWSNDGLRGTAKGKGFKGDFQVTETHIVVSIDLSWVALPFKGRVHESLKGRFTSEFGAS